MKHLKKFNESVEDSINNIHPEDVKDIYDILQDTIDDIGLKVKYVAQANEPGEFTVIGVGKNKDGKVNGYIESHYFENEEKDWPIKWWENDADNEHGDMNCAEIMIHICGYSRPFIKNHSAVIDMRKSMKSLKENFIPRMKSAGYKVLIDNSIGDISIVIKKINQ